MLGYNQIKEIKGLDTLINLHTLRLENNRITEIKGLKKLAKLKSIRIKYNPLVFIAGFKDNGQKYVEFCKQNKKQKKYKPDEIGKCEDCGRNFPKLKISKLVCCGMYCKKEIFVCPDCYGWGSYTCPDCEEMFDAMSR